MWQSSPWQQFSKKDWCRKKFCLSSCPVCCPNESEMQIKICFYFNCNKICCWLPKWINYSSSREGGGQRLKSKHTNSAHFLLNAQNLFLRNIKTEHFLLVQLQEITNLSKLFCHSNGLFFYHEKLLINISQDWNTYSCLISRQDTSPPKKINRNHMDAL